MAERDAQVCECGVPLSRVQAFAHQQVWVPFYMRAAHDETTYLPQDEGQRQRFLRDAYQQHGRWRSDLAPGRKPAHGRADRPVGDRA